MIVNRIWNRFKLFNLYNLLAWTKRRASREVQLLTSTCTTHVQSHHVSEFIVNFYTSVGWKKNARIVQCRFFENNNFLHIDSLEPNKDGDKIKLLYIDKLLTDIDYLMPTHTDNLFNSVFQCIWNVKLYSNNNIISCNYTQLNNLVNYSSWFKINWILALETILWQN